MNAFKSYDADKSGTIDGKEFKNALKAMGHTEVTDDQANEMLKKVDKNSDNVIEWIEFLDMMQLVKKNGNNFGEALTQGGKAANVITSASGAKTSYKREEVSMISRCITNTCKEDELVVERLPINPDNDDVFHACSDGMVLVHLMKHIDEDCIDMRTINKGSNMKIFKVRENLDQALGAASTRI